MEPTEEHLITLKNPNLLGLLIQETDKKVVREVDVRKTIIAIKCGSFVENSEPTSYNLFLSDESGMGKDYVISSTLEIFPKETRFHKKKITPELLTYWHNEISDPAWTWDGKSLHLEEISYSVLNSDTLTGFLSSKSYSGVVLIKQKPTELKIKGKPSIFVTSASKNLREDQLRRFAITPLNDSINQTKEITLRKCDFAEVGKSLEYNMCITEALMYLKRIKVKVPFAKKLGKVLLKKATVHRVLRTNISRYLDLIKSMTALYQYQRIKDLDGYYLATLEDYENILPVLNKVTQSSTTIPITKEKRNILDVIEKLTRESEETIYHTVTEIEAEVTVSKQTLYKRLKELVRDGFLIQSKVERINTSEKKFFSVGFSLADSISFTFPTVEELESVETVESVKSVNSLESIDSIERVGQESVGRPTDSTDSTEYDNNFTLKI